MMCEPVVCEGKFQQQENLLMRYFLFYMGLFIYGLWFMVYE